MKSALTCLILLVLFYFPLFDSDVIFFPSLLSFTLFYWSTVLTNLEYVSEFPLGVTHYSSINITVDKNCQGLGYTANTELFSTIFLTLETADFYAL